MRLKGLSKVTKLRFKRGGSDSGTLALGTITTEISKVSLY